MASHPLLSPDSTKEAADLEATPSPAGPDQPDYARSESAPDEDEDDELDGDLELVSPLRPGLKRRRTGWLEYQRLTTRHVLLLSGVVAVLLVVVGTLASLSGVGRRVGRWEYRPPMDPSKRAVMIEKRNLPNLVPLLHDFITKVSSGRARPPRARPTRRPSSERNR